MSDFPLPATCGRKLCRQCGKLIDPASKSNYRKMIYCSLPCFKDTQRKTPEQKLWARATKDAPGGCWLWTGYKQPDGYGQTRIGGKTWNSHKLAYVLVNGPVPKGMEVMHSCHVRHCINPAHMRLGTHQENVSESVARGTHTFGERNSTAILTEADVLEIRRTYKRGMAHQMAQKYGVKPATIKSAIARRTWRHL